jgi:hypothetical protein
LAQQFAYHLTLAFGLHSFVEFLLDQPDLKAQPCHRLLLLLLLLLVGLLFLVVPLLLQMSL